jgi:hypothetical protein
MPNIYTQPSQLNAPVNLYIIVMFPASAKSLFLCVVLLNLTDLIMRLINIKGLSYESPFHVLQIDSTQEEAHHCIWSTGGRIGEILMLERRIREPFKLNKSQIKR